MKSHKLLLYLMVLASTGRTSCPVDAQAKTAAPKSVLDYFLLLPQNYFNEYDTSISRRKNRLLAPGSYRGNIKPILDRKNDYIFYPQDSHPPLTVALFKHNRRVLVAVHTEYEGDTLHFLRYNGRHWEHVTRQVSPVAFNESYSYQLPRNGR